MPIQFACTNCGQPIEVDDEHAGQSAACPYCRHVVRVPDESTYRPDGAIEARPAEPPAPQRAAGATAGESAQALTAARARKSGIYGLLGAGLAVALFTIAVAISGYMMMDRLGGVPQQPLTAEQNRQLQEEIARSPVVGLLIIAGLFSAVVGLVFGVVSVSQQAAGNWRGWLAVAVCAAFVLCNCVAPIAFGGLTAG